MRCPVCGLKVKNILGLAIHQLDNHGKKIFTEEKKPKKNILKKK